MRLDLKTWVTKNVLVEGGTTALHAVVRNTPKQPVANPMVIVGLLAGLYLRGLKAEEARDMQKTWTAPIQVEVTTGR